MEVLSLWPNGHAHLGSGSQKALENVDVAQRHQSHDSIYTALLPFFISNTRDSLSSQWNMSHENPMEEDHVMETFLTLQWEFGSQHSGRWLAENPEFQLSNFTRRLLGMPNTAPLRSTYPRLNGTQPIPNRPAVKPFSQP